MIYVSLVDENGEFLGVMEKLAAHKLGCLHQAYITLKVKFSCNVEQLENITVEVYRAILVVVILSHMSQQS